MWRLRVFNTSAAGLAPDVKHRGVIKRGIFSHLKHCLHTASTVTLTALRLSPGSHSTHGRGAEKATPQRHRRREHAEGEAWVRAPWPRGAESSHKAICGAAICTRSLLLQRRKREVRPGGSVLRLKEWDPGTSTSRRGLDRGPQLPRYSSAIMC